MPMPLCNCTMCWRSSRLYDLARELSEFGYRETDYPGDADRRRFYKVEKLRSCTSRRSGTPAMTSAGRRRSSPPRRSAGRAAAIRCTRESVCCNAGR